METSDDASFDSRPLSGNSSFTASLLQRSRPIAQPPEAASNEKSEEEPQKPVIDDRRWVALLCCLPHLVPLLVTIVILVLNGARFYWQEIGKPGQSFVLQGLQYVTKAHELMMAASRSAIVIHRLQFDLTTSKGAPLGFLGAGYQPSEPTFVFSREFFGGATSGTYPRGISRYFPYSYLLILGFGLTALVGPSSAVAMIPRLDWWFVPKQKAFGDFDDRMYLNRAYKELWPSDINTGIYANISACKQRAGDNSNCVLSALSVV